MAYHKNLRQRVAVASGAALDGPASSMTCSSCLRADRPEPLRAQFRGLATAAQISHATELAPTDQTADEVLTTSLAQLAGVVRLLDGHLAANKAQLAALVGSWMPELLAEFGVGPVAAAQLLVSWSHPGRCRSAAAFAMLAGTTPLQASSGRVTRHRLNRGGDRQLNRALQVRDPAPATTPTADKPSPAPTARPAAASRTTSPATSGASSNTTIPRHHQPPRPSRASPPEPRPHRRLEPCGT